MQKRLIITLTLALLLAGCLPTDESTTETPNNTETPVDETPAEETPVAETPAEETPVAETPVEETPVAETPVEETPVAETPAEETPVAETPVEETPVAETPVEETPVAETPVEETPVAETPAEETPVDITYNVSGLFQKGPLIHGSTVSIYELDKDLQSQGRIYITAIQDDFGSYEFNGQIKSQFVEIEGEGYFQNEITGTLSSAPIKLRALADLKADETSSVNLITTLSIDRVRYLAAQGVSFSNAVEQAYDETLITFNIPALVSYDDIDILGNKEASKIALAISVIALQYAKNDEAEAGSFEAALSNFIAKFNTDLRVDGTVGDTFSIPEKLLAASTSIEQEVIKNNISLIMDYLGLTSDVPSFEEYVDLDGDGLLTKDDDDTPDSITFHTVVTADPHKYYSSNEVVIQGLADSGFSVLTSLEEFTTVNETGGFIETTTYTFPKAKVFINNIENDNSKILIRNNDIVRIEVLSGHWNYGSYGAISIGTDIITFNIETRNSPIIIAESMQSDTNIPTSSGYFITSKYFAYPFTTGNIDYPVKYAHLGAYEDSLGGNTINLKTLSIHTDSSNSPETEVISTANVSTGTYAWFSGTTVEFEGRTENLSAIGSTGYFGEGVYLQANTNYWLIAEFNTAAEIGSTGITFTDHVSHSEKKTSLDGITWIPWAYSASTPFEAIDNVNFFIAY